MFGLSFPLTSAVVVMAAVIATPATATDRYFPDIKRTSPDNRYRLDAKSPDNNTPDGRPRPFAKNFTYTLTDTQDQRVLWTYQQGKEASPVDAWVHENGWVVVRTGWDELVVFNPADGAMTANVRILDQFPAGEQRKHVHTTTAGPMWSQSSRWYFVELKGTLHFVVRAHWGRRVIVELKSGKVVTDQGEANDAIKGGEREWVLTVLRDRVPELMETPPPMGRDDAYYALVGEIEAAIDAAAHDGIKEAVPLLRDAEECLYVGSSGMIPIFYGDRRVPEGEVNPFAWSEFTVRFKAQTALRRLGERPSDAPATIFRRSAAAGLGEFVQITLEGPREEGVKKIAAGATALDILALADGPDRVVNGREIAWEYHIDGDNPHSFHVFWSKDLPPRVTRVEKITPPTWRSGNYDN